MIISSVIQLIHKTSNNKKVRFSFVDRGLIRSQFERKIDFWIFFSYFDHFCLPQFFESSTTSLFFFINFVAFIYVLVAHWFVLEIFILFVFFLSVLINFLMLTRDTHLNSSPLDIFIVSLPILSLLELGLYPFFWSQHLLEPLHLLERLPLLESLGTVFQSFRLKRLI